MRAFGLDWISCLHFALHFLFYFFQPHYLTKSTVNNTRMHCSWVSQIPLFSQFFIKNGSHSTIHTFKNYFPTIYSISVKISLIQTDYLLIGWSQSWLGRTTKFVHFLEWTRIGSSYKLTKWETSRLVLPLSFLFFGCKL